MRVSSFRFVPSLRRTRLLVVAAALGCVPVVDPPAPLPAPRGWEDALVEVGIRQALDDSVVAPGGRTILLAHGERTPRVYVLLHGFTDAPTQFEAIGRQLYATGDNVYIPRLPHHAVRRAPIAALGQVRAAELARFGDSVIAEARGLGDSVIVVGLSAGGVIAAHLAQTRPEVLRAVLIAPAIAAGHLNAKENRVLVGVAAHLPDIHRTSVEQAGSPGATPGVTTRGLAEVLRFGERVRDEANGPPPRAGEIVFLLNARDRTVSEEAALDVAQRWLDNGGHVLAYRFPESAGLPHNVIEPAWRGGNPDLVYPVVTALAEGTAPPRGVELLAEPCRGLLCTIGRLLKTDDGGP